MQNYTPLDFFFNELRQRPGLIPVSIDVATNSIQWMDLEKYHFYEGFFHRSVKMFTALKRGDVFTCTTSTDVLLNDNIITDYVYPTAFIFHAGRCGSTLLAKVLARVQDNLIISEPDPLNNIHLLFNQGEFGQSGSEHKTAYRNLILAMARRRVSSHQNVIVKFTSYNIRFFDFIHAVFPDVPAIFLTRDVDQIVKSCKKSRPGWLDSNNPEFVQLLADGADSDIENIVRGFINKAANCPSEALKHVAYNDLTPDNLPSILGLLNVKANDKNMELMKTQFLYDSKKDVNRKVFQPGS